MKVGDRVRVFPCFLNWVNAAGRIAWVADGGYVMIEFDDEPPPPFVPFAAPTWILVNETSWYFVDGHDGAWTLKMKPKSKPCVILLRIQQGNTTALIVNAKRRLWFGEAEKSRLTAGQVCKYLHRHNSLTVTSCSVQVQRKDQAREAMEAMSRITRAVSHAA